MLPLPPEAPGWPLLGVVWQMRRDPLSFMLRAMDTHGDVIRLRLGHYMATLVRNPEDIRRIFVDNAENYTKQTRGYRKSKIVLGQGLVTSEGELWKRQRRIATPAFGRQRVESFVPSMVGAAERMMNAWRKKTAGGEPIDAFAEMMRLTLDIAVETLLGTRIDEGGEELSRAVTTCLERTNDIITNPFYPPMWLPTPKNVRLKRAIGVLDRFVFETIERRRAKGFPEGPRDLLSMLMEARDEETGEGMSARQLRDEAVTILIAGHETTANALTWALYLLGQHPEAERRLHGELDAVLRGRAPVAADVPKLRFTRAVVDEAMRLYPPAWMIGRCATKDDVLGGRRIEGGSFALVSPYVTHRHPGLWDRPGEFDPDRFLDGRAERLPKFAYLPFGGGQRFCVGSHFALVEATLLLAAIRQRTSLRLAPGHSVRPFAMITLRPRDGVKMRVAWRE